MGQLVAGVVGGVIGWFVGGPTGAQWGFALGSAAYASAQTIKQEGPKLDDLKTPKASYGSVLPYIKGMVRTGGVVAWNSDKIEIRTVTDEGGKGGPSTETTQYTYMINMFILFSENELAGIRRVWSNGKLIYNVGADASAASLQASLSADNENWGRLTFYSGAFGQLPDPTMEAAIGVGLTPGYEGRAGCFIENLRLGGSGSLPMLTFEVFSDGENGGGIVSTASVDLGGYTVATGSIGVFSIENGNEIWAASSGSGNEIRRAITQQVERVEFDCWVEFGSQEDDGCLFFLRDASLAGIFVFNPRREDAFDPLRRATITGLDPIGADPLTRETWVHVIWDKRNDRLTITDSDGATYVDQALGLGSTPLSPAWYGFQNSASGGKTTVPTRYRNVRMQLTQTAVVEDVMLHDLLEDLFLRAEMDPVTDMSLTNLTDQVVRGLPVSQIISTRGIIESLMMPFNFECTESEGVIKFVSRGAAAVKTIEYEDMGAVEGGDSDVEPLPLVSANDIEVPAKVIVQFINGEDDYRDGAESDDRLVSAGVNVETLTIVVVLTPSEAKKLAQRRSADLQASLWRLDEFSLLRNHIELEPTDVLTLIDEDGTEFRARILKIADSGIRMMGLAIDDASSVNASGTTDDGYVPSEEVTAKTTTVLALLDIPIQRDADDNYGHYLAVNRGTVEGLWPGANVVRGVDNAGYTLIATLTDRTFIGTVVGTLPNSTKKGFDHSYVLTVNGIGHDDFPVSYTYDQVVQGQASPLAVGSEIIYYLSATQVDDDTWEFRGLLRGRKGTEWAKALHEATETVVLLQSAGMRRPLMELGQLGVEFDFKAATTGFAFDTIDPQPFTNTGIGKKCYAVVGLTQDVTTVRWHRRSRKSYSFTGAVGSVVPLGETTERYEVDVYNVAVSPDVLVATLSTTEPEVDLSVLSPDPGAGYAVTVYQLNSDGQRGYPASLTLV